MIASISFGVGERYLPPYGLPKRSHAPHSSHQYIRNYGNEVNLFVDPSQIVQLEALRSGIWGTKSAWGRIQNFAG
jgi:hypothetical protein